MALPTLRAGGIEVAGLSDGILKTSLDLVIGMDRPQAESSGRQNGQRLVLYPGQ